MKYKIGIVIICIALCGIASAQTTDEMQDRSNQIAANVTMFIVTSVQNQQHGGMINSSSFNEITNDAVTMAINQMAENDPYIQPINKTVDYVGVMSEIQLTEATNTTNYTEYVNVTFDSNTSGLGFIDSILNIINNFKFSI